MNNCPYRPVVRTSDFESGNPSSTLGGVIGLKTHGEDVLAANADSISSSCLHEDVRVG